MSYLTLHIILITYIYFIVSSKIAIYPSVRTYLLFLLTSVFTLTFLKYIPPQKSLFIIIFFGTIYMLCTACVFIRPIYTSIYTSCTLYILKRFSSACVYYLSLAERSLFCLYCYSGISLFYIHTDWGYYYSLDRGIYFGQYLFNSIIV